MASVLLLASPFAAAAPREGRGDAWCAPPPKSALQGELASQLPLIGPRVIHWAQQRSEAAIAGGAPLSAAEADLARSAGVRHPEKVRVMVVEQIPLPDEPALKAASARVGLSQSSAAGLTLGYAVIVRRGYEADVRLMSHEFRHVAQYEACGGIPAFLSAHLGHLAQVGYEASPFEVDARAHEVRRP